MAKVTAGTAVIITGVDEIDRKLSRFEQSVQKKAIRKATREAAKVILEDARQRVPVDTGALRKSLRVRSLKRSRVRQGHQVMTGEGFFKGDTFYGGFVEYGTKRMVAREYMKKAMVAKESDTVQKFRTELSAAIEEAAR